MTPPCRLHYPPPPVDEAEALRYAGGRGGDGALPALMQECIRTAAPLLSYRVCYRELPLSTEGTTCRFGGVTVSSASLARHLGGCTRLVLFAATIGLEIDRLIARQGRLSPSRALMLQGFGAERIEALCDLFCSETATRLQAEGFVCRPRFSPGYGDLPLALQGDLFALLDCERAIGLTLTASGLMSPTKSVTALIGAAPMKEEDV